MCRPARSGIRVVPSPEKLLSAFWWDQAGAVASLQEHNMTQNDEITQAREFLSHLLEIHQAIEYVLRETDFLQKIENIIRKSRYKVVSVYEVEQMLFQPDLNLALCARGRYRFCSARFKNKNVLKERYTSTGDHGYKSIDAYITQ